VTSRGSIGSVQRLVGSRFRKPYFSKPRLESQGQNAIDRVSILLTRCAGRDTVLPPTVLFNEGWTLPLVLGWAEHYHDAIPALRFDDRATALFRPTVQRRSPAARAPAGSAPRFRGIE
jgi:hypothetical protein